ncbi:MAG: hypothetical protein DRZ80_00080 [Thermoprotei archaeon]|nr:MAG: hypothetical protein DRZ80_00080 [Thermoprotei archaeon]
MNKTLIILIIVAMLATIGVIAIFANPIQGKGALYAKGEGTALIKGSGKLVVRGEGVVIIEDYGEKDVSIRVWGDGSKEVRGNTIVCWGKGKMVVKGKDLLIHIRTTSPDSEALAYGKGWVVLSGEGAFKTWKP